MAKRKYKMSKRLEKAYENYTKRYEAKKKSLSKRGYEMADKKLNQREYEMVREAYINEGVSENINQTIVSDQAYEYSQKTARRFKATAKKFDLEWKSMSITELRKGGIDVSELNDRLKEMSEEELEELYSILPANVKHTRQGYISYEVFGSD